MGRDKKRYRHGLAREKSEKNGERKIGLMFQEDVLFPHYNVYKNIEFGIHNADQDYKDKVMLKLLEEFKLKHVAELYPGKLSGGEKVVSAIKIEDNIE